MTRADEGSRRIVFIASTAGLKGYPYVAAYCAAKHGVVGLMKALSLELAMTGVTVNAVCPGYTDTPLLDDAAAKIAAKTGRTADQSRAMLAKDNAHGRLITPDEVAQTVLWLCSPTAASVNGQAIAVMGGPTMTMTGKTREKADRAAGQQAAAAALDQAAAGGARDRS